MEDLKLKSSSGIAKIAGVALSLAGVLVIAFYAGPSLSPVNHHRAFTSHTSGSAANVTRRAWAEWTFLMVLANMTWSLWILMQAPILRECPNKLLVTTVESVFSMLQSFIVAAVVERDFSRWMLRFDVSLLAILYSGFVVMGVAFYLQAWCVEMKGSVFLSVLTPLCFVLTMFCSSFFLGENVHVGSIVGAILLVAGLYSMLWGKTKENNSDHIEQDGQHQQEKSLEIEKCNGKEEQEQRMASKESTSTGVSTSPIQHV